MRLRTWGYQGSSARQQPSDSLVSAIHRALLLGLLKALHHGRLCELVKHALSGHHEAKFETVQVESVRDPTLQLDWKTHDSHCYIPT